MPTIDEIAYIYNAIPTPSIILKGNSPNFTIVAANNPFLENIEKSLSTIIDKDFFDEFPALQDNQGQYGDDLLSIFKEVLKSKRTHQIKNTIYNSDITVYPLLSQSGEVEYIVQSLENIAQSLESSDSRELAQGQGFELFNFCPTPMVAYNRVTSKILAANNAAQDNYGYSLNEFLNLEIQALWPTEDLPDIQFSTQDNVKMRIPNKGTVRHIKKDATIIYVEIESLDFLSWGENTSILTALDITENIKIQEKLLASESQLRNLLDAQTIYVVRVDLDWNYTYFNNKYKEDFGWQYGEADLMNKSSINSILPDNFEYIAEVTMSCVKSPGKVFQLEATKHKKDGKVRSTFWHFIGITDQYGHTSEIQCIGLDITERKVAETALKSSHELYDYVNKATNDAIYDWDILENNLQWGEAFSRVFGYRKTKGNFPIEKWMAMLHSDEVESVGESLARFLKNKTKINWTIEYRLRKSNGEYAFVQENGYVLRNKDGEAIRMIGVLKDVSQRMEHELKIREHLERYNVVFKATSDTIWDYNVVTNEVVWNNGIEENFGHNHLENTYQWWCDHVHPDDLPNILAVVKETIAKQQVRWIVEYRFKCADGTYKFVLDKGFLIRNDHGEVVRAIGAMQDITDRINYIHTIEQRNLKLRDIAWAQTHLVRAPLARIIGIVQLLYNEEAIVDTDDKRLLSYLDLSAKELDLVIKGIIDKSQI